MDSRRGRALAAHPIGLLLLALVLVVSLPTWAYAADGTPEKGGPTALGWSWGAATSSPGWSLTKAANPSYPANQTAGDNTEGQVVLRAQTGTGTNSDAVEWFCNGVSVGRGGFSGSNTGFLIAEWNITFGSFIEYATEPDTPCPALDSAGKPSQLRIVLGEWMEACQYGCNRDVAIAARASLTISRGPVVEDGGEPVDPPVEEEDYCGVTLNPLNYLKCLFLPSPGSMQGWSGQVDGLKARPPFSVVTDSVAFVQGFSGHLGTVDPVYGPQIAPSFSEGLPGDYSTHQVPRFSVLAEASRLANTSSWYSDLLRVIKVFAWAGFALWAWVRISASLGGKETV